MNRTDRLHALSEELRRAGLAGRTASRLAAWLEVSTRTIKRDVSALQQAGLPVWAQAGPGGGYVLSGTATLPPVNFTETQAVAVAVALAAQPDAPYGGRASGLGEGPGRHGTECPPARRGAGRAGVGPRRPAALSAGQ